MTYCKDYCEEKGISTSKLSEPQQTLYYIAENMKMKESISERGYKHFQMAIKALEQEPCEDGVSRQAVLNKILKFSATAGRSVSVKGLWTEVNDLPSVTPQPKTEHWIPLDKIKKLKEEVGNKYDDFANSWDERTEGKNEMINEVLELLDKLIESEEE